MRNIFGWDLPPGCSTYDIDVAAGVYDECIHCGKLLDDCICEEPEYPDDDYDFRIEEDIL